jgi:enoyl-CoA hydratase/carnithine racemase
MSARDPSFDLLLFEKDETVAIITLNRPDQMNAISRELEGELHQALRVAASDESVKAIVLTGAGAAFSAGYDLGEEENDDPAAPVRTASVLRRWWDVDMEGRDRQMEIMRLDIPVIAAVDGWCLGGGMWYALACDITLASDRAVFGQPEVRETQNSTFLVAALAGWKNAQRYALTGDHFDAHEAYRIGLVNEVVPPDELLPRAIAMGKRIGMLPRDSIRLNKAITTYGMELMGLRAALDVGAFLSVLAHGSTDAAELDELYSIRREQGMRASLKHRDGPYLPEPGGPRSKPRES